MSIRSYKNVLVAIDERSRQAVAQHLINKDGSTITYAFIKMTKHAEPKCIISDHGAECVSNGFMKYLDRLQLQLHVNAFGDHHALGIMDILFAKRIFNNYAFEA